MKSNGKHETSPAGLRAAKRDEKVAAIFAGGLTSPESAAKLGILLAKEKAKQNTLFDAIAHGDERHRAWLKAAIEDHFSGRPVRTQT